MRYIVSITRRAQKELARLLQGDYKRTRDAIFALARNPRSRGCLKLAAREGWRIRVDKYRVIYEIDDKQRSVVVLHVGLRRDVYRQ